MFSACASDGMDNAPAEKWTSPQRLNEIPPRAKQMSRVLLINMPFSSLRWPNIGPSLLKAALARRGIGCDVAYLNFDFAERTGIDHYNWIADDFAFVLGGERLFAGHYFDTLPTDDESYYRNVLLAADGQLTDEDRRQYERTARHVGPFLDRCTASIDWTRYGLVGFAVSFQQTMPSMCLARRIKQLRPDVRIALGGAACEGEMGIELLHRFPPVDYVFLGEADVTFPAVVEQLLSGGPVRLPPGVVGRDPREAGPLAMDSQAPDSCMVRRMDDLPYPDYDDYFARLGAGTLRERIDPLLPFETSRGCWWGRKHQCVFCGLNGGTLAFRGKSPGRAVDELRYLVDRHNVHRAYATDNILDLRYFDTFLPALERANLDLSFAFEMKVNLTRRQVEILLAAGLGAAQLGIETLSTPLLGRIGKGTTALHNVQALKWFTEAGIAVQWNLLYGFPGEEPEEYAAMAELLPSLVHLAPPQATGRVRMDRFAPYFNDPAAHGLIHARPSRAFRHVYPFPDDVLARMAYYYEYDHADGRNPLDYAAPVLEAVETWRELAPNVTLRYTDRPEGVLILHDTRPEAAMFQRRLSGIERAVYLFCDTGRSLQEIIEFAARSSESQSMDESFPRGMLAEWVDARITAHLDNRYLSLALRVPSADSDGA